MNNRDPSKPLTLDACELPVYRSDSASRRKAYQKAQRALEKAEEADDERR